MPEEQKDLPPGAQDFVEKVKRASRELFARGLFTSPDSPSHPKKLMAMGGFMEDGKRTSRF